MFANPITGFANYRARPPMSANLNGRSATIQDIQPGPFGGPCLFLAGGASGDYVTVRRGLPALNGGNGTVEFWMLNRGSNYTVTFNVIYDMQEVSTEISITIRNNNTLSARARFGATTTETAYTALGAINTWNHIAITLEENKYITLWINGNRIQTIGNGTDTLVHSGGTWNRLGANCSDSYFAEYRLSTNVRYDRSQSTYTVPTAKFVNDEHTYWLFHFDNIEQRATNGASLGGNAQLSTAQSKFGNSIALDGNGDYVYAPNHGEYTWGNQWNTDDHTIELFFYLNAQGAYNQYLVEQRPGYMADTIYTYNGSLFFYTAGNNRISGGTVQINTWHHLALSKQNSTYRLFLDGSLIGSYTNATAATSTGGIISFGGASTSGFTAQGVNGYIDEIRVSGGLARYTANFAVPTEEFVLDANTLLLIHGDEWEFVNTASRQTFDDAY